MSNKSNKNEYEVFVNGLRVGVYTLSTTRPFIYQLLLNAEEDPNHFAYKKDANGNKVWARLKNKV